MREGDLDNDLHYAFMTDLQDLVDKFIKPLGPYTFAGNLICNAFGLIAASVKTKEDFDIVSEEILAKGSSMVAKIFKERGK